LKKGEQFEFLKTKLLNILNLKDKRINFYEERKNELENYFILIGNFDGIIQTETILFSIERI